jgi:hypothetical protein
MRDKMSDQSDKKTDDTNNVTASDAYEDGLDVYPLRGASDDPRWAVRIVWIWVGMALFLLLFLITLFILGLWFD